MRIDMKRAAEVNQRKGLTWRTLLSLIWFVFCLVFAFLFTGWLVNSGPLNEDFVYGTLSLPPELNMQIVRVVAMALVLVALQFVAVIYYVATNPAARERTGQPTATAQSVDYYEKQYNRQA